jgi:hypothetical protein
MPATNTDSPHPNITDQMNKDKHCNFEFRKVRVEEVNKLLLSINNEKPPGSDNLDGKFTEDNSEQYCHSYLPYLQSKHTRKCMPSGLEGSKMNSSTQ